MIIFFLPKIFWKTEGFTHETFRHCKTNKCATENSDMPFPMLKFLSDQKDFETQQISPRKTFGCVRQKIFDRKMWDPYYQKKFPVLKHFWNTRVPVQKFLLLPDKYISMENRVPPPLNHKKIFHTKSFLKHGRIPLRCFWFGEQKTFIGKSDTSFSWASKFSKPEFFGRQEGSPTKIFRTVRQKLIDGKLR